MPREFYKIIDYYRNYVGMSEPHKKILIELEDLEKIFFNSYKKKIKEDEIIELIEKSKKILEDVPEEDFYHLIMDPDFLVFMSNFRMEVENYRESNKADEFASKSLENLYDFCYASHKSLFKDIYSLALKVDNNLQLLALLKFLLLYPRIAELDSGTFTDNREEVLDVILKFYYYFVKKPIIISNLLLEK